VICEAVVLIALQRRTQSCVLWLLPSRPNHARFISAALAKQQRRSVREMTNEMKTKYGQTYDQCVSTRHIEGISPRRRRRRQASHNGLHHGPGALTHRSRPLGLARFALTLRPRCAQVLVTDPVSCPPARGALAPRLGLPRSFNRCARDE
jgi:hypothetical protein